MPSASGALAGVAGGYLSGGPVGAIIGGIGGLFGSGGKSKLQKGLESKVLPVTDNLINWSGQANDARTALQPTGIKALQKSAGFYEGVLSDDDVTSFNSLVGPQRQGINA